MTDALIAEARRLYIPYVFTQEQVAARLGVHRSTIRRWLRTPITTPPPQPRPARVDRQSPQWQRIRRAIGVTARGIDPDCHADSIWLVVQHKTGGAGSPRQKRASTARQETS